MNSQIPQYSFWKGFLKALIQVVAFGLPIVINALPAEWMNITVGGALSLLINYIKVKYKAGTPN